MQRRVEQNAAYRKEGSPFGQVDIRDTGDFNYYYQPQGSGSGKIEVQTDPETGKRYMPKREVNGRELRPIHSMADKMRGLFSYGAHMRESREEVNPMWHKFDDRCVQPINSVEEMKALLKYHGQSDAVMFVRYWQEGCTACNALDKVFEWACQEQRRRFTKAKFFDIKKEAVPELCEGMVRYPQVKGFSAGQWGDIDFKPPQDFRETIYARVEKEVHAAAKRGQPVSALQAEEMYFSVAGPAVAQVLEEDIMSFYNKAQVRLHNYWKQVSVRRSWYFKNYVDPVGETQADLAKKLNTDPADWSAFGEATAPTLTTPSAAPHDIPNASPSNLGAGMQE